MTTLPLNVTRVVNDGHSRSAMHPPDESPLNYIFSLLTSFLAILDASEDLGGISAMKLK